MACILQISSADNLAFPWTLLLFFSFFFSHIRDIEVSRPAWQREACNIAQDQDMSNFISPFWPLLFEEQFPWYTDTMCVRYKPTMGSLDFILKPAPAKEGFICLSFSYRDDPKMPNVLKPPHQNHVGPCVCAACLEDSLPRVQYHDNRSNSQGRACWSIILVPRSLPSCQVAKFTRKPETVQKKIPTLWTTKIGFIKTRHCHES